MASQAKYDVLWRAAHDRIRDGDLRTDAEPVDGDTRWGLSLVLLPDTATSRRLASLANVLADAYAGEHHIYEARDLHLTIMSLEPYRDHIDTATLHHYVAAVDSARDLLDVHVELRGRGGSASGVFVQGFDHDTLRPLRSRMREAAAQLHDHVAPAMAFVRDTAHISLSVHRRACPEPAVVDLVDRMRPHEFGDLDDYHLTLVRYRPGNSGMTIEQLHQFDR